MKTIAQLQSVLSAFPCPFAAQSNPEDISDFPLVDEDGSDSDFEGGNHTNFETGIPSKYSPDQATPSLLPRGDFNRIGEIASRELFFRSAGGIHTFDKSFASVNNGYADRIALAYDDGKMIRLVESQEQENDLDFKTYPAVIDSLANKPSDVAGTAPRVLWKSVSHIYGLAEGMLHVGVDYSRKQVVSSGEALDHDSFVVIGASFYGWGDLFEKTGYKSAGTFGITVDVGSARLEWRNKGLQGEIVSGVGLVNPNLGPIYPYKIYGGANAPLSFFARKGTTISYSVTANGNDQGQTGIYAYAYPLEAGAAAEEGGGND